MIGRCFQLSHVSCSVLICTNFWSQWGNPRMVMPSVVSIPSVNLSMHLFRSAALDFKRFLIGDVPFGDVRILLLSRRILSPICLQSLSNSSQKRLCSKGTTAVRSSTNARRLVMPPSLLSSFKWFIFLFFVPFFREVPVHKMESASIRS